MSNPEIRQCRSCNEPTATCIRDWQHQGAFGNSSGSTQDYCCQNCGARFTLSPTYKTIAYAMLTVLFSWTCIGGLIFGAITAWCAWPAFANPVVPGAPAPPIRFSGAEPTRRCASCGGVSHCKTVTRSTSNGIPTGTEYEYACSSCGAEFTLETVAGHFWNLSAGLFLFAAGFACMPFGLLAWLLALFMCGGVVWSVVQGIRNPLISVPVDE